MWKGNLIRLIKKQSGHFAMETCHNVRSPPYDSNERWFSALLIGAVFSWIDLLCAYIPACLSTTGIWICY
ncbi:hypothetical protein DPEC_G00339900 [Dallia pectoralis]|uniref:Uncharacterized protein n=1 Tax=Dallia pectoralis TaxID=75939 RepID=A0ACC2F535_DALPE|nr:hypothetical protein DPEC_G00339900 [Dallia pectoralis]